MAILVDVLNPEFMIVGGIAAGRVCVKSRT